MPAGFKAVGPTSGLHPQPGSRKVVDRFGMDVLTRGYRCRQDMLSLYEPTDKTVDFQFPELAYNTHTVTFPGGGWCDIVIEFAGLINGEVKRAQHSASRRWEKVQLTTDEQETVDCECYAFVTTYRYVSTHLPTANRFSRPLQLGTPAFSLVSPRPATFKGALQYQVRIMLDEMSAERRGLHYACAETWACRIQPVNAKFDKAKPTADKKHLAPAPPV
jgi:hypothetical protein